MSVSGQVRFGEIGSGVLISPDGKVMTAAHVVHAMDEITVEFIGGEAVKARVVASEPAADLSLIQLERVPAGVKVARLANSSSVRVGDQALVVGAPYGLVYSLSVGLHQRPLAAEQVCIRPSPWPSSSRPTPPSNGQLRRPPVQHGGRRHRDREPQHLEGRREAKGSASW